MEWFEELYTASSDGDLNQNRRTMYGRFAVQIFIAGNTTMLIISMYLQ
jgi:hypothetical protein